MIRRLLIFLLSLAVFVAALVNPQKVHGDLLAEEQLPPPDFNQKILPLDLRSLSDWKVTDLLLVSDIDGNLHGVERNTGAFLWTLPIDEPLVKIQRSESKTSHDGPDANLLWFVEPTDDGSLYYFSPLFGLNKLPTSIKDLVMESPFSLAGDTKIYTGSRRTSLYTIDLQTGTILSHFGSAAEEECPVPNVYGTPRFSSNQEGNIIMIGKTTYELSIHSKLDMNLMWNVTYSQWGPNNIDNDLIMQHVHSIDNLYFTPFHDKSLLAINRELGTPSWISKLPSLAVNVFDVFSNENEYVVLPHPSKVLNDLQLRVDSNGRTEFGNNDLCFLNKTANGKEWFAMSFRNYPTLLKSAPVSPYQIALYRYENGAPDVDVKMLSEFDVFAPEAEVLMTGVHRINYLAPENMYQPEMKFKQEAARIGDGSGPHNTVMDLTDGQLHQLPSLMDGLLFPNTPSRNRVSVIDDVASDGYEASLPANVPSTEQVKPVPKVSVFRRVAEDLLVLATLFLFLLMLGKVNLILRDKGETQLPVHEVGRSETGVEALANTTGTAADMLEEILTDERDVGPKRVTIIAPEDASDFDSPTPVTESKGPDDEDAELVGGTKKKRKRGSRGGKRGGKGKKSALKDEDDENNTDSQDPTKEIDEKVNTDDESPLEVLEPIQTKSLVKNIGRPSRQLTKLQVDNNLVISDKILGYGSHGTVVYRGSFENRPVAVKRMLLEFYDIANHEVRLLQESDDHPNVVRYFCSQSSESEKFLYIALELCVCSLEDIIEKLRSFPEPLWIIRSSYCEVLHQLASGLNYLHSLKIVHRDLKPQNILVGETTKKNSKTQTAGTIRLLISDFGLCKKLDADQSSFRATTQHAASGTAGWRAPELLLHQDLLEISPDTISSVGSTSRHSIKDGLSSLGSGQGKRLTKAIDIFSLGCVFYYILSGGGHPFGDRYLREGNIIRGEYNLDALKMLCPDDYVEAGDLIESMISFNPKLRPDTATILKHPYFWNYSKKLEFLLKVSDRFEIERRDPPSDLLLCLELVGSKVHNNDWLARFDLVFTENLGRYRKYNTDKLMDLLRALRNKYHHYNDMPSDLQSEMSPLPHGFYLYFNSKFPNLLMQIYYVIRDNLKDEHVFQEFY